MKQKIPEEVLKEIFQKKLKRRNIDGEVYQKLKKMILSGKLTDGQRLVQEKVAHHFSVSRQTVRNAFAQLKKDRLIINRYKKGAYVSYKG